MTVTTAIPTTRYADAAEMFRQCSAVVPHTDADGLAAAAIALRFLDRPATFAVLLDRGQNPFNAAHSLPEGSLAILDQGIRQFDRPALFVDHHAPELDLANDLRADQLAITGFGEPRGVSTSVLMRRIVPDAPAWLAALGATGDYGDDGFKQPECAGVVKATIRKLVPLINAPRRCPDGPVRDALQLLLDHDDPKKILKDDRIELLERAKLDYRADFDRVVRTAPRFIGDVAILRFASPYQVHPLVAQTWSLRLAPKAVLAANDDYVPGKVNFAMRTANGGIDLRELLRRALPQQTGEFANGHRQATGGSITKDEFERLLESLASTTGP